MLKDHRHITTIRVRYAETDRMGVAYHSRFIEWFEVARTEFLREAGIPYTDWEAKGYGLPVTEVHVHYHRPARYDDELTLITTLTELNTASMVAACEVRRDDEPQPLAGGWVKLALVGPNGRPARFPEEYRKVMEGFVQGK